MLWQLISSTTMILNQFPEGSQIQTYNFVREPHENFTTSQLTRFVLLH